MAPSRHTWLPEERDAIRILWHEYDLDIAREKEAYAIFSHLYTWSHTFSRVHDEWRTRGKGGKSPAWASMHDKSFAAYTVAEQQRRAEVPVGVVGAARALGIDLTPIFAAVALHANAVAALAIGTRAQSGSLTINNHPAAIASSANAPAGIVPGRIAAPATLAPPVAPATSMPPPVSRPLTRPHGVPSTMPVTTRSGTRRPEDGQHELVATPTQDESTLREEMVPIDADPDFPGQFSPVISSGARQAMAASDADTDMDDPDEEAQSEDDQSADLWMVHYIDLHPNTLRMTPSDPRYRCARTLKFRADEHPSYRFGGHVMRIISDMDIANSTPRSTEDVMICNRDYCEMCFSTAWEEELKGMSPTLGLPFVHFGECEEVNGRLVFDPSDGRDYENGVDCQVERKVVRYACENQTALVVSAVCVPDSCERCTQGKTIVPIANDDENDGKKGDGPGDEDAGAEEDAAGNSSRDDGKASGSGWTVHNPSSTGTGSSTRDKDKGKRRAV